ncbi:MAG: alginate lyase family protein [Bacteroides xylanisolvens]
MKNSTLLLISATFFLFSGIGKGAAQAPATRIYDGEKLAKVKVRMQSEEYAPAIAKLMSDADKALKSKPVSVMDKDIVPASGDKHDYMSMGPYWWPDPTQPDGLPYIRKDGVRNPNATSDRTNIGKTISNILALGTAYYFSDNEKYAAKAAEIARGWFINPETRMNPNMNYGQMIPGRNGGKGRGFGMIDAYSFIELLDVVEMMSTSASFTKADRKGLKQWFTDYLEWIRTSSVANEERNAENNHGLAFDVQQTVYALFTGDSALARKTISEFAEKRLFPQIEPDGKQPRELARTTGFGYTNFNLIHMMDMCALCKTLGIDIYNSTSKDGRNMKKALEYMASFIGKPQSEFPYQQIKGWDREQQESCWVLRRASFYDKQSGWEEISRKYMKTPATDRRYLLYSLE